MDSTGLGTFTFTDLDSFMQGIEWVYGFFIIVSGYLSTFIPGVKKIDKGVYRVLALAIVIGAGFYFGAGTSLINLVLTYTFTTSFYEVALKLITKKSESSATSQPE
jgi:hypothetical protein